MSGPQELFATQQSGRERSLDETTDAGGARLRESIDHGRFLPGTIVAERYRITHMLGRGGMGEVYRADDLKLEQPVALKFLPARFSDHAGRVDRFLNEVRVARQVSHANVCRVYDVGDVDGAHYLSMEYVDGEDLASLLRRIGRLPGDKAVQIARQLCAGLAAAHERSVLHRDLKPANIMIDGRGRVRITDFGLAGLIEEFRGAEIRVGTPAYMSPEQLEGREVSARSDIYSLGLVLYEMFTGKPAFTASNLTELMQTRSESMPSSPSTIVPDLDPAVERVILRCLEADPRQRPSSVLAIAAALPGGNPLAAALAAGETPSPELVAAASVSGVISPAFGVICAAVVLLGLGAVMLGASQAQLINRVAPEKRPEVLIDRARALIAKIGYDARPLDTASGFEFDRDRIDYIRRNSLSPGRWRALEARPAPLDFWFRQSPRLLTPKDMLYSRGIVSRTDPPPMVSGMVEVLLDPAGRLISFRAVPMQVEKGPVASAAPDWATLFEAADLQMTDFRQVTPEWLPPVYADRREAWVGALPGMPDMSLRVEAAACRGRPVFFEIIHPWSRPTAQTPREPAPTETVVTIAGILMFLLVIPTGLWMARRNLRLGRGDRRGATRAAALVLVLRMAAWALVANHVADFQAETRLFVAALSNALYVAALCWVFYVALEPYVRRLWPDTLVGWTRALAGQCGDPLVGRDVLIGAMSGIGFALVSQIIVLLPGWTGGRGAAPLVNEPMALVGGRGVAGTIVDLVPFAIFMGMFHVLLLLVLRVVTRREWIAATLFVFITTSLYVMAGDSPLIDATASLLVSAAVVFVIVRFGLLAASVSWFVQLLLLFMPVTTQVSAWYASAGLAALAVVLVLAGWGLRTALAGRPLLAFRLVPD